MMSRPSAYRMPRALVATLVLALAACQAPVARLAAPNVLLIVIDCLRSDHVGAYGHFRATTPNLDALAAALRWAAVRLRLMSTSSTGFPVALTRKPVTSSTLVRSAGAWSE